MMFKQNPAIHYNSESHFDFEIFSIQESDRYSCHIIVAFCLVGFIQGVGD